MDDKRKQLYLFEIKTQSTMLAIGAGALRSAGANVDATWFAVHSILGAAGNISKLLWGTTPAAEEDRRELRDQLEVGGDSPLRFRDVRNKFEHIDEYIDEFIAMGQGPYASRNVGGGPEQWGGSSDRVFGHYDPESGTVWFWEWEVSIPALLTEASSVGARAWDLALARWV